MQINCTTDVFASLASLINFIEANNTAGAGVRWLYRYERFLQKSLANAEQIKLCTNRTFMKLNLKCVYYNDWLIAFSINKDVILIEALLHRSELQIKVN